jgi:hypothetical protein
MMKTLKTSSRRIVITLLAATMITVGIAIPIVKPAYAQLDINERVGEIEIPDSDDIKEKAREIIASQPVPTLPELGTALGLGPRSPPALAD